MKAVHIDVVDYLNMIIKLNNKNDIYTKLLEFLVSNLSENKVIITKDSYDILKDLVRPTELQIICDTIGILFADQDEYMPYTYEDREMFRNLQIRHTDSNKEEKIIAIDKEKIYTNNYIISYKTAFNEFVHLYGTPFGKQIPK